jgi:hypothetical protein
MPSIAVIPAAPCASAPTLRARGHSVRLVRLALLVLLSLTAALAVSAAPALATVPPSIVGEPQTPEVISSLETSAETAGSADLDAKVVPGGEAKYRFEYGTTTGYGHVSEGSVAPSGSPAAPVAVSAHVTGLSANTTYHWRLAIENAAGKAVSVDHTFVYDTLAGESAGCLDEAARQARGSVSLPDCRAYEMVTPPEKNGGTIGRPFVGFQEPVISNDGTKLISSSLQCFAESPSCIGQRGTEGGTYEFARTPSGWVTHPLVPAAGALGGAETYTTWAADPNLGTSLYSALAPTKGLQEDLWVRQADGALTDVGPLEAEGAVESPPDEAYLDEWLATADLSHVVYETFKNGSVWGFDPSVKAALYEYADTDAPQPHPFPLMVGVTGGYANGENRSLVSVCSTLLGTEGAAAKSEGSLSQTGRTVFFRAEGRDDAECAKHSLPETAPAVNQLWARVDGEIGPATARAGLPEAHSVLISAATAAAGSGCTTAECLKYSVSAPADAGFEAATPDGSAVVFSSTQQLTNNAGEGSENLYESVCAEPCGTPAQEPDAAGRELFDVSEAQGGGQVPGGPRVLGLEALSADGSHVYFVAEGVLTGSEENHNHEQAQDGQPNLYVFARDVAHPEGRVAFIATLSSAPEQLEDRSQNWIPNSGSSDQANVTPDGRFLVFTSHRALTADDTRGDGPAQVYEYDAQAGLLTRVSVGQDGYNDNGLEGQLGSFLFGPSAGDATIVPAHSTLNALTVPARSDPTMANDGSFVFFQSPVALTPGALNDVVDGVRAGEHQPLYAQNFYEYHDGHVYLLTSVTTETGLERSRLLGTDTSGSDVFFGSFEPLVPEDVDANLDFYDAHVCSETAPCNTPVVAPEPCGEGGCQASGGSPSSSGAGPASETFSGAGNLAPDAPAAGAAVERAAKPETLTRAQRLARALRLCRAKHARAKRVACERAASKAYGAVAGAKKSSRRATR